ncbi:hypothetical protein H2200_001226 [Cladophialophora chaetospira]|uniref:Uncharacterized protein n=1 Tax=Cladophialophora chaetospira TaxID=386627 RepID=A0AA38XKH4_9EURO|nr:hypothetical protein H2200_001226 [Cladophialophora chaetospira]
MAASPTTTGEGGSPIDLSKDFEFRLEFDIEEDIEGELESFVRLARLGLASKARECFEGTLRNHVYLFPVFAEYVEFLVTENRSLELIGLCLDQAPETYFSGDESWFRKLVVALAATQMVGLEKSLLEEAQEWHDMLASKSLEAVQLNETQLQCLEIYLRIIAHFSAQGILLGRISTQPPTVPELEDSAPWHGFVNLVLQLFQNGKNWEAHNLTRLLFALCGPEEAKVLYDGSISSLEQRIIDTGQDVDEIDLLIRAGITNAYLKSRLDCTAVDQISSVEEELIYLEDAAANDLGHIFPDFPWDDNRHSEEHSQNSEKLATRVALFRTSLQDKEQDVELPDTEAGSSVGKGHTVAESKTSEEEAELANENGKNSKGPPESTTADLLSEMRSVGERRERERRRAVSAGRHQKSSLEHLETSRKTLQKAEEEDSEAGTSKPRPGPGFPLSAISGRPTYHKVNIKYLSPEILNRRGLPWEYDADPEFVIIKQEISDELQDELFAESKSLTDNRRSSIVSDSGYGSISDRMSRSGKSGSSRPGWNAVVHHGHRRPVVGEPRSSTRKEDKWK